MTFPAQLISYFNSQQYQIKYDTPGTYQFTVPEGVSSLSAVAIGGGGGGAGSNGDTAQGTGGGGGGGTTWAVFGVQPGDILNVSVGSGGTGGSQSVSYDGMSGSTSYISIVSRPEVGAINQVILRGVGGSGGGRNVTARGAGGAGGIGSDVTNTVYCPIYLNGGGSGGFGGTGDTGASGGGGAGGYNGTGGIGGGLFQPTAASTNSGGGGGGGGSATGLGYGGGGTGSFGFVGTGQGVAGINDAATGNGGGDGASYFIDPNEGILADFVSQSISVTNTIDYPTGIGTGDFLLLLSGSDAFTGTGSPATNFTSIPVPIGFTTIAQSNNGVYTINSSDTATAIIPNNTKLITPEPTPSRDLNFTSSYRYVPMGGLSGTLTGLTTSSIHNMIALRNLPSPVSISWATDSADPALNTTPTYTLMPDPPSVTGIPSGALAIALGFLSNTPLNPGTTAGANTIGINTISGGVAGESGRGVGLVASYLQTTASGTYNPDAFLTGTTAHSRAYSIQINRSVAGTPVTVVGSAVTSTLSDGTPITTLNLPTGAQAPVSGDLLIYLCATDSPTPASGPNAPTLTGVTWNTQTTNIVSINPSTSPFNLAGGNLSAGTSDDKRGSGGLGFRISYGTYSDSRTQLTGLTGGTAAAPASHMVIVLRNAAFGNNTTVWDNGLDTTYGPPDPPALTTNSTGALVLAVGMIDNIAVSNVTIISPPTSLQGQGGIGNTSYTMLAQQSYGVQNNGAIIMSAYKSNLTAAVSEDPSNFVGGGGNIWASQTLIIGGPQTLGTKTNAGLYGGGGGSMADVTVGSGMDGGQGSVRIIWGTGRRYPSSNQTNQSLFDSVP